MSIHVDCDRCGTSIQAMYHGGQLVSAEGRIEQWLYTADGVVARTLCNECWHDYGMLTAKFVEEKIDRGVVSRQES